MVRTKGMKKEKKGRTKRIQNKRIRRTSMKRRSKVSKRIKRSKRSKKSRVKGYKRKRLSGKQYGAKRITVNTPLETEAGIDLINHIPPMVINVKPESIAHNRGVKEGSYLIRVNGWDVSDMNLHEAKEYYNGNGESNNLVFDTEFGSDMMEVPATLGL